MIEQRILGLALLIGGVALSYITFGTYWFGLEATNFGKATNIVIIALFLVVGVFFLVKKDSKASF